MSTFAQRQMILPTEDEVQAAVQRQHTLAAYLATDFETQYIHIFNDRH